MSSDIYVSFFFRIRAVSTIQGHRSAIILSEHWIMSYKSRNPGRSLPFGLDYSDVISGDKGSDKPQLLLPVNGPLSEYEEEVAKLSIKISRLIADGPFNMGNNQTLERGKVRTTEPDGIERHSDKYRKVKTVGKTIKEYPYALEMFPEELYSVIGVPKLAIQKLSTLNSHMTDESVDSLTRENDTKVDILEKLKDFAEDLDADGLKKYNENEEIEEEFDDEFEEDEDDDYNAEKYFDDGDDDMGDDGDEEAAF